MQKIALNRPVHSVNRLARWAMVRDSITDQSARRGENCCNSNFLRSTILKFSGNDQRTLWFPSAEKVCETCWESEKFTLLWMQVGFHFMRIFSPMDKGIAIGGGQSPEDGDLPQKCAERFLKTLSELEIHAEEWKIVPWVWEIFCNISDLFTLFGLKFWTVSSFTRESSKRNLNLGPEFSVGVVSKVIVPFRFFLPSTYKVHMRIVMTAGETMGTKWRTQTEAELKHHRSWKPIHRDHCSCPEEVCCQLTSTAWTTVAPRPSRSGS